MYVSYLYVCAPCVYLVLATYLWILLVLLTLLPTIQGLGFSFLLSASDSYIRAILVTWPLGPLATPLPFFFLSPQSLPSLLMAGSVLLAIFGLDPPRCLCGCYLPYIYNKIFSTTLCQGHVLIFTQHCSSGCSLTFSDPAASGSKSWNRKCKVIPACSPTTARIGFSM